MVQYIPMSLLHFYGEECPHCKAMHPFLDKIEKETGAKIERLEVWHNEDNMKYLEKMDKENECGGVPYFINTDSGGTICGEASYEELKDWATGKIIE